MSIQVLPKVIFRYDQWESSPSLTLFETNEADFMSLVQSV